MYIYIYIYTYLYKCCFQPQLTSIPALQLRGSNDIEAVKSFYEVFASAPVGQDAVADANGATAVDLYNQSVFFKSDATGLVACSLEINNTPLMPQPLKDTKVYNEILMAVGNHNQYMSSGIHPDCVSLAHSLKHYFIFIGLLENIQQGHF